MTTVRTEAPTDDMSALGLARRAARAAQAPATVLDMAAASIALSLADPPLPRFAVQIGTAEPEPAAGTVPLASADTLPDDVVDEIVREVNDRPGWDPSERQRGVYRAIADAMNVKLRAQLPDEAPTVPAPFVRGVDELSDDEVNEDARGAWPWGGVNGFDGQYMGFLRDFATAVAARLRVDGPGREPEPAEITAAMLDAAHVGATVTDRAGDVWRKDLRGWTFQLAGNWQAETLLGEYGPLTNLRPPEPATSEPLVIRRSVLLDATGQPEESWAARQDLIAAALRAAAEACGRDGTEAALASAWADVDKAAREHVAALLGPATGGAIAAPGFAVTDEDVDSFFDAQRDSGDRTRVSLRDFERRAMEHYARRLASRETGTVIAAPGGLPELSQADVEKAEGISRNLGLRAALGWYRLRLAGTPSTGGYDPAKLADGSVILADGRTYTRSAYWGGCSELKWLASPPDGHRCAVTDVEVPLDGTLVVDGATLGGAQ